VRTCTWYVFDGRSRADSPSRAVSDATCAGMHETSRSNAPTSRLSRLHGRCQDAARAHGCLAGERPTWDETEGNDGVLEDSDGGLMAHPQASSEENTGWRRIRQTNTVRLRPCVSSIRIIRHQRDRTQSYVKMYFRNPLLWCEELPAIGVSTDREWLAIRRPSPWRTTENHVSLMFGMLSHTGRTPTLRSRIHLRTCRLWPVTFYQPTCSGLPMCSCARPGGRDFSHRLPT
jgi:hypothetical protein